MDKTKTHYIYIVISFTLYLFCGCTGRIQRTEGHTTRIFEDMAGRKIEIPLRLERIFIDRHSTLMFYSLDTVRNVNVGFNYTDTEKRYLKKSFYENKPYVIEAGSHEEIVSLKPDIILWSQKLSPDIIEKADILQKKLNIPVILMDMDISRYKEIMRYMGSLLDKEQKSAELISFIESNIDPIPQKIAGIPQDKRKRIYYAEGINGLATDPKGSVHSLLIELCGGDNVARSVDVLPGKGMTSVSIEQIYAWNPEYILVWSGNFDSMSSYKEIKQNKLWSDLNAVKQNKVIQVPWRPFGWIDRPPGMNRLIGYMWLSNTLFPEEMNIDIVKSSQEFFRLFYHYNLSHEEAVQLSNPKPGC